MTRNPIQSARAARGFPLLVLALALLGCSADGEGGRGGRTVALYDGRVVLEFPVENAPVDVRERRDLVSLSEGFVHYAFEIEGPQPESPVWVRLNAGDADAPERLSVAHLGPAGAELIDTEHSTKDGELLLEARLSHFSVYFVLFLPDPHLVARHPVGDDPTAAIAPCWEGVMQYGTKRAGHGLHSGRDFICKKGERMVAKAHGRVLLNTLGDLHGFGFFTASHVLLENASELVDLGGHRCDPADIGEDGLVAGGQDLGLVDSCGASDIEHVHDEAKLLTATTLATDYVGPCFGYCSAAELGQHQHPDDLGYRDTYLINRMRQPLIPQLRPRGAWSWVTSSTELTTFAVAGEPTVVRLVLRNPSNEERLLTEVGVAGIGPDGKSEELFVERDVVLPPTGLGSGKAVSGVHTLTEGTHQWFARARRKGSLVADGYPMTVEVVPPDGTTVIDNLEAELSAPASALRGGGYFLDHLRVPMGSKHWARWRYQGEPLIVRVFAYVPDDGCSATVRYGLDGGAGPKLLSAPLDQSAGTGWREIAFEGGSAVGMKPGAFVDVVADGGTAGGALCIDAVKLAPVTWCSFDSAGCAPECGGSGEPCCAGSVCDPGFACDSSVCKSAATCGSGACDGAEHCGNCPADCPCGSGTVCQVSACVACGGSAQPCCAGSGCNAELLCAAGVCVEPATTCGSGGCDAGENCGTCPGDCPCASGSVCQGSSCVACGATGQPCCSGHACNASLGCVSDVCVSSCTNQYSFSSARACGSEYCIEIESVTTTSTTVAFTKANNQAFGDYLVLWFVKASGKLVASSPGLCGESWNGQTKVVRSFPTSSLGLTLGGSVTLGGELGVGPGKTDCLTTKVTGTIGLSYACK
jgi:hypothetical protein